MTVVKCQGHHPGLSKSKTWLCSPTPCCLSNASRLVSHLSSDPPPPTPQLIQDPQGCCQGLQGTGAPPAGPGPGLPGPKVLHSPSRCLQEGPWDFLPGPSQLVEALKAPCMTRHCFLILLLSPPPEHRLSYRPLPLGEPGSQTGMICSEPAQQQRVKANTRKSPRQRGILGARRAQWPQLALLVRALVPSLGIPPRPQGEMGLDRGKEEAA